MPRLSIFVAVVLLAAALPASAAEKLVTVNGDSTVSVAPDTAIIRIGVTSQGKNARAANETNAKQMTAVLAAVKSSGIAARDIQTSRLSIQPVRASGRGMDAPITGFQTTNQVTVMLRDVDKLSGLLDKLITAGANTINGIDFTVTKPQEALDKLRAEAVEDARRKAEIYAKAAGGTLGKALAISEGGVATPYPKTMMLRAAPAAVPVAPGEETLRVHVSVTFGLTP